MFGFMKKYRCEKKVKSHNIPEDRRNHFLIVFLTFIMSVIPPLIVAIISHFTIVYKPFDNMVYFWLSILFWLTAVLSYPNNEVFYFLVFGLMCMMYGHIIALL